jgi:hypothetical protein
VTLAPNVATHPHEQLATSGAAHACPVDGSPCDVVAAIAPHVTDPRAVPFFARALPCGRCRGASREALAGVRLGKNERSVLLVAADSGDRGAILEPAMRAHSDRESFLRAGRSLQRARLLTSQQGHATLPAAAGGTRRAWVRRFWCTPFGAAIVERYRAELESGARIRWDERAADAARAVRLEVPALLAMFRAEVRTALDNAVFCGRMSTAVGRHPDPDTRRTIDHGSTLVDALARAEERT